MHICKTVGSHEIVALDTGKWW